MHFFKLQDNKTTIGREFVAGMTTFLTMSYIIFVHPAMLSKTGMDHDALVTVTILASILGTLLVGLWANVPFAMAPGMGLNAFFTYTLVLNEGLPWQTALGVVFLSGVFFLLLTVLGVREKIIEGIPLPLRLAVGAGIGIFISFIGLQDLGLVVDNDATMVGFGRLNLSVVLGLVGLGLMVVLEARRIRGAILIGILVTTALAIVAGYERLPDSWVSAPHAPTPILLQLDILAALKWGLLGSIFSFMFVDLFDSVGTIVACSYEAGLVKENGHIEKLDRMLMADATATVGGALLGTSTTTSYIEAGSGIAVGGRTGLSSVFTAACFALALLFTDIVDVVPKFATAGALIMVGVYMFRSIREIDFHDLRTGVPAFLTIVLMPLTYSITIGFVFGFLSYILISIAVEKAREIHPVMWVVGALSLLELVIRTYG